MPDEESSHLQPSVLDRLMQTESPFSSTSSELLGMDLAEIRECVRRDLQDLLNTRWRSTPLPRGQDELAVSLVNYGLPDFSGADLASPKNRRDFCRVVQRVIESFEPRLRNVRVLLPAEF